MNGSIPGLQMRLLQAFSTHFYIGLFFAAFAVLLAVVPSCADIYMYIDEQGNYFFTDAPTSSKYRLFIKEKKPTPTRTKKYDEYISEASRRYEVDSHLIKAIVKAESNFDPQAVSRKGAKGLMQIMPQNFDELGISNPFDPRENIMAGTKYLRYLLNQFDDDLQLALAAYNAGPNNVDPLFGIPHFPETKNYVEKVISYYNRLKND
jgi:soluble lytic murein transglycosylase-like protein